MNSIDNDKLTWTAHIDGVAEVGLNPGVTVKDAILRLAEYEHEERISNAMARQQKNNA